MSERYEYYNTGDNTRDNVWGARWRAQTFTPSVAHKVTSVKLKLFRNVSPGFVTVSIKATDGEGHPTGIDLCSGTTDGNTLPLIAAPEWREITLGDGADLLADTKYAIVVRVLGGDEYNYIGWRADKTGEYAGGNWEYSNNSGSSWAALSARDFMFEEWGEPLAVGYSRGYIIG